MITWFYFIVFVLSLIMTISFFVKNRKIDTVYMLFAIFVTINCMGRYMLATSDTLEMALWSNKFMYVGACFVPLLTLHVLIRLCNFKMPKLLMWILTVYSIVVLCFVFTIGEYGIYYKSVELAHGNGYNYLVKEYGPMHSLYPAMVIVYAVIMVIYMGYAIKRRHQISFRTVGTICVMGVSIIFMYILERIIGSNVSFLAVGYLIAIAMFIRQFEYINMYDISANISNVVERLKDYGYISFDCKYRYINSNGFIKEAFPEIKEWRVDKEIKPSDSYMYKEVIEYLMNWDGKENNSKTIKSDERYFELNIRRISYGRKGVVGFLLEFTDRTLEKKYYNTIEEYNSNMEREVAEKTAEIVLHQKKLQRLLVQTVTALSEAVDAKDRYTSGHSKRVAKYARMIAERMGKSREEQDAIYRAGLLHDVGKIRIPADIINKSGKLTDEEYNIIKIHPVTGYHILKGISDDNFIAIAAKYHHERYDGKGYPNGLAGEKIPEVARILGVADSYDAMASNRSYRKALPQEVVRGEIEKGRGTQFDPVIADIMLEMIDEDKDYTMKQAELLNKKILSVDDEFINNKIITHILKDEPMYEVVSVGGGREALEVLGQQDFDLVLLDVMMPDMDGLETLKLIRNKYQVPVVLMTADKTLDFATEFSKLGCDDFITKPVLPTLLKELVHNTVK